MHEHCLMLLVLILEASDFLLRFNYSNNAYALLIESDALKIEDTTDDL